MTLNIYLLFFTLFFSLIIYVYVLYINEEGFELALEEHVNANERATNNFNAVNPFVSVKTQDAFMGIQKKAKSIQPEKKIEIKLKLKKYSQQLNRSLNTLTYISVMEADSVTKKEQLKNLLNLKANVQYEIVRITKKISYYRSLIEDSIPA